MNKIIKFVASIAICEFVGIMSVPFTITSIPTWYATLHKPFFSPPNWIFGPVWTTLYFLMGISMYLVWGKGLKTKKVKAALLFFVLQLLLNFIWSILFFGFHSPLFAFVDIILLLFTITLTIVKFYKISKPASYLLLPYLLWVSFATLLNFSILVLNR